MTGCAFSHKEIECHSLCPGRPFLQLHSWLGELLSWRQRDRCGVHSGERQLFLRKIENLIGMLKFRDALSHVFVRESKKELKDLAGKWPQTSGVSRSLLMLGHRDIAAVVATVTSSVPRPKKKKTSWHELMASTPSHLIYRRHWVHCSYT